MLQRLVKKTLYIGFFAFIIGNFNSLAGIVFESFSGLGLQAGGSGLSGAELLQPGRVAQLVEVDVAQEDGLLLACEPAEVETRIGIIGGVVLEPLLQPGRQFILISIGHLAGLLDQRRAIGREVFRIEIRQQRRIVRAVRAGAGLHQDRGARPCVAGDDRADAHDRALVAKIQVAPGDHVERAGAGDPHLRIEDVAAGRQQRDVGLAHVEDRAGQQVTVQQFVAEVHDVAAGANMGGLGGAGHPQCTPVVPGVSEQHAGQVAGCRVDADRIGVVGMKRGMVLVIGNNEESRARLERIGNIVRTGRLAGHQPAGRAKKPIDPVPEEQGAGIGMDRTARQQFQLPVR